MKNFEPQDAKTDLDIYKCLDVMAELRMHLKRDDFLQIVREMEKDGYCLAFIEEDDRAADCQYFRLDSDTARAQAHKFYFNWGVFIF